MRIQSILASALVFAVSSVVSAGTVQIQLGGVNIGYNGSTIVDAGAVDPDALTNATFLDDNVLLGVDNTDVTLDLTITGVLNIPATGGQVNGGPGTLDLVLGGGEFLSLTLDSAVVTYVPLTATIQFVFAGAEADIVGQLLPFGLVLTEPVSVSFSTQIIGPVTTAGGFVTGFTAAGTGEIQALPEPASMALMALGLGAVLARRRR